MNNILLIIIFIVLILYCITLFTYNYIIQNNDNNNKQNNINKELQNIVLSKLDKFEHIKNKTNFITLLVIFLIIFFILFYYISNYGFKNGLWEAFLGWIFFTIATPTPQSGLLLSLPLKFIYNISMDVSQLITSICCLLFIFIIFYFFPILLKGNMYGNVIDKIIDNKAYTILLTSSIGSTTFSGIIDKIIDFFNKKTIQFDKLISYIILTITCFIYYNKEMKRNKLYKIL